MKKKKREEFDPMLDVTTHQPVNDVIPYFSVTNATSVPFSKTPVKHDSIRNEKFYSGYCFPESYLHDKEGKFFVFKYADGYVFFEEGSMTFVDHEDKRWPTK